ncbi:PRADC1-like protein [Bacillus rossius redtenbacheri]|uniref:PRADC1-like protein n=1 Tax=Bacillus rossius redtenbacheri TaxID=93214 RepID=UPI002FDE0FFE
MEIRKLTECLEKVSKVICVILLCYCDLLSLAGSNIYLPEVSTAEIIGSDVFFEIIEPKELEYTYRIRPAKDFGVTFNETFSGRSVPLVPVDPPHGCSWPQNAEQLEGSVALIDRGDCSFLSKTLRAEQAGARAVIVTDSLEDHDELYIEMIDDNTDREVHIPAGFLVGKNGIMIKRTLEKLQRVYAVINIPVNLTFTSAYKINEPPWMVW